MVISMESIELGEALERRRARKMLTQEEAAEEIGISHRSYQRYCTGGTPGIHQARRVAEWLGVEPWEVCGRN